MGDRLWPRASDWLRRGDDPAEILVAGVPSSRASITPSRADRTPAALRSRLTRFSTFAGEGAVDLDPVTVRDLGDWAVSGLAPEDMIEEVERLGRSLPPSELRMFLGGDNAITRPLVRAAGPLGSVAVLTFDAHHDVRETVDGPSNGTPIRGLIEDGLPGRLVAQVGIHSFANSVGYRSYCLEAGIGIWTMQDVDDRGVGSVVAEALASLDAEQVYVDVDVDVLDRAFAPGCPGARPGGMTVRQLATGVRTAARDRRVVAFDFVEVDPERDPEGLTLDALATVFLAAVTGYAERRIT